MYKCSHAFTMQLQLNSTRKTFCSRSNSHNFEKLTGIFISKQVANRLLFKQQLLPFLHYFKPLITQECIVDYTKTLTIHS